MLAFLKCCGEAVVAQGLRGLMMLMPFGGKIYDRKALPGPLVFFLRKRLPMFSFFVGPKKPFPLTMGIALVIALFLGLPICQGNRAKTPSPVDVQEPDFFKEFTDKFLALEKPYFQKGEVKDQYGFLSHLQSLDFAKIEPKLWVLVEAKHPESARILQFQFKVYFLQMRYTAALNALNKWIDLEPNSGEALFWRGRVWEQVGSVASAVKDFRQALAKTPQLDSARWSLLQLLLLTNGDPNEILEHVQNLLKKQPMQPKYLVALASCKILVGEFPAARKVLDQVLQINPDHAGALFHRAELEFQDGQFAAAEKWARLAAKQSPGEFKVHLLLAECLKRQNDPNKLKESKFQEQKYQAAKGDAERLRELITGPFQKQPNDPKILAEMGGIFLRSAQDPAGLFYLTQVLEKHPFYPAAHKILAEYYLMKNEPGKAAKHQKLAELGSPK